MRLSPDALAGLLRPPPPKPKQPTSRERAAAIRQLQLVHASTHPGARRRLRASQTALDAPAPHPDPKNAAEAFLQALADEADADEDGDLHP